MYNKILLTGIFLLAVLPSVHSFTYTNENIQSAYHEAPVHFERLADGSFWGYTESGKEFRQIPVPNQYDVRMHKFMIDEAFFYVTEHGTLYADSDLQAISIYLMQTSV